MQLKLRLTGNAETMFIEEADKYGIDARSLIMDCIALHNEASKAVKDGGQPGYKDKNGDFQRLSTISLEKIQKYEEKARTEHKET